MERHILPVATTHLYGEHYFGPAYFLTAAVTIIITTGIISLEAQADLVAVTASEASAVEASAEAVLEEAGENEDEDKSEDWCIEIFITFA